MPTYTSNSNEKAPFENFNEKMNEKFKDFMAQNPCPNGRVINNINNISIYIVFYKELIANLLDDDYDQQLIEKFAYLLN